MRPTRYEIWAGIVLAILATGALYGFWQLVRDVIAALR
jgi:hypothetical protein